MIAELDNDIDEDIAEVKLLMSSKFDCEQNAITVITSVYHKKSHDGAHSLARSLEYDRSQS